MKTILFSLMLLLSCFSSLTAQDDFYLPVSSTSESAKKLLLESEKLFTQQRFEDGMDKVKAALAEDPNLILAYVFPVYSDTERALKEGYIDRALAIDPANFNDAEKIIRGQMLEWKKNGAGPAAASMNALVTAYPNTPQAYHWASLTAGQMDNDPQKALMYAEKLATLAPDFAPNFNTLGYMYLELKNMKAAKKAFEKQVKMMPNEANPYDSMADYYMAAKDYKNAVKYYEMAVARGMATAQARADKARGMM